MVNFFSSLIFETTFLSSLHLIKRKISFIILHSPFKDFHEENANIVTIKMKCSSRAVSFQIFEWRRVALAASIELMNSAFRTPCSYSFTLAAIMTVFY